MDDMQAAMVNDFWDDEECEAPSSATRRLKLLTILRNSYRSNERLSVFCWLQREEQLVCL
jgi:hypothetical protein